MRIQTDEVYSRYLEKATELTNPESVFLTNFMDFGHILIRNFVIDNRYKSAALSE